MALAAAGVLAASPHNTQPWLFHVGADAIEIHAVPERHLGAFDPYRREMMIALGCAVENMVQAAPGQGLVATTVATPNEPTRIAHLALTPGPRAEAPLAAAIVLRHTNRFPYDTHRPVAAGVLSALQGQASDPAVRLVLVPRDSELGHRFSTATIAATQQIIDDDDMDTWSARWTRSSRADIDRERSGLTLAGAGLDRFTEALGAMLPPTGAKTQGRYWLDMTRSHALPTAAAFGMLFVKDPYDRVQSLQAGRLWQRLHLTGTLLGLAMQPLNQIPEAIDREKQLGKPAAMAASVATLLPDAAWHLTFGLRLGLSNEASDSSTPTPAHGRRHPCMKKLLDAVPGGSAIVLGDKVCFFLKNALSGDGLNLPCAQAVRLSRRR